MDAARIREIMLANGFTIKDGCDDLKPYVYQAAQAIAAEALRDAVPAEIATQVPDEWREVLAEVLSEAESWIDDARGCAPSDIAGYTGWAERARALLASAPQPAVPTREHLLDLVEDQAATIVKLQDELEATPLPAQAEPQLDYAAVLADRDRLVRELDVLLNGENAAKQASLCDLVAQVKQMAAMSQDAPQQAELVATVEVYDGNNPYRTPHIRFVDGYVATFTSDEYHSDGLSKRLPVGPLYLHPAPAPGPLTDEQIQSIWIEHGLDEDSVEEFARAIERAALAQQPACGTPSYCRSVQRCTAQDELRSQPAQAEPVKKEQP